MSSLDLKHVINSFNKAAITYDRVAILQRETATRLLSHLEGINHAPNIILDIGSGTGYTSQLLSQRYKKSFIISIDMSLPMLKQAKKNKKFLQKQTLICADTLTLPFANHSIDFICSNLLLHWTDDINRIFKEWQRVLKPGGLLLFSSCGPDTLKELRLSWNAVDQYPHVHPFVDMHDLGDSLVHAGFADPVVDTEHIEMQFKDARQLLQELKQLGAVNANAARHRGLTGKNKFKQMLYHYESYRTEDAKIPATYEIIYGHAWGALLKNSSAEEFEIPLTKIRRA